MQIQNNNLVWQDLSDPDSAQLKFLEEKYDLSPIVFKDLLGFNKRPKIEEYDNYLFWVIHFPVYNPETRQTTPTELDFIIAQDFLLTVHQNTLPALDKIIEEMQTEKRRQYAFKGTGFLLFYILDRMIDSCLPMLDHIHEDIEHIEQQVFDGKEREMLKEIAIVKRDIIDFRRTIKPQRAVLELLNKKSSRFFKEDLEIICQEVVGSEIRVWNTLENHKEMIEAIESTNSSLLSFQINQVMHTLTFFSIILFSLTFIAGFFSMKMFDNSKFPDYPWNLCLVSGIMLFVVILVTGIFKRKKWL